MDGACGPTPRRRLGGGADGRPRHRRRGGRDDLRLLRHRAHPRHAATPPGGRGGRRGACTGHYACRDRRHRSPGRQDASRYGDTGRIQPARGGGGDPCGRRACCRIGEREDRLPRGGREGGHQARESREARCVGARRGWLPQAACGGWGVTTTELRDYVIAEGALVQFVEEWRRGVVPLRRAHGYRIHAAWTIPEERRFVWLLSLDVEPAEWEARNDACYADPARAALD